MLSRLDEVKTVTGLPVDPLLPQQESVVAPDEEESSLPAAQPGHKTGQSRARRAKGRRLGATATAGRNRGEKAVQRWIYFGAVYEKTRLKSRREKDEHLKRRR